MSGVEIRQRAAYKGQKSGRRGQEGGPPLYIGLAGVLFKMIFRRIFLLLCTYRYVVCTIFTLNIQTDMPEQIL